MKMYNKFLFYMFSMILIVNILQFSQVNSVALGHTVEIGKLGANKLTLKNNTGSNLKVEISYNSENGANTTKKDFQVVKNDSLVIEPAINLNDKVLLLKKIIIGTQTPSIDITSQLENLIKEKNLGTEDLTIFLGYKYSLGSPLGGFVIEKVKRTSKQDSDISNIRKFNKLTLTNEAIQPILIKETILYKYSNNSTKVDDSVLGLRENQTVDIDVIRGSGLQQTGILIDMSLALLPEGTKNFTPYLINKGANLSWNKVDLESIDKYMPSGSKKVKAAIIRKSTLLKYYPELADIHYID